MRLPWYRTAKLAEYYDGFQQVAREVCELVRQEVGARQVKRREGNYSIIATSTQETVAKIIIYQADRGNLVGSHALTNDGVYILIRENGQAAHNIWDDVLPQELPWFFRRMRRDHTVAVAPNYQERFTYFPVMAGENLEEVARLLCASFRA